MQIAGRTSRLTLFVPHPKPRSAVEVLDEMDRILAAHRARVAAENAAWDNAAPSLRRIEEGHRCLLVIRAGMLVTVPMADLRDAELGAFL